MAIRYVSMEEDEGRGALDHFQAPGQQSGVAVVVG